MARRSPSGLSIGQLITLTFGFLLASVLIFICGWWVGYDMAEQRLAKEQQVTRLPAPPPPTAVPTNAATARRAATAPVGATLAAGATAIPATVAAVETIPPTHSPRPSVTLTTKPATATVTRTRPPATPTAERPAEPTADEAADGAATEEIDAVDVPASRGWTIQASATTDTVQAIVLTRRLKDSGFDAYTATKQLQGVMWYQVRVGRFRDREEAIVVLEKLKSDAGLEAAFVTPQ